MKNHYIIQLINPLARQFPFWGDVAQGLTSPSKSFFLQFDQLLLLNNIYFEISEEYPRHYNQWSQEEILQGFNRVYRLVILNDQTLDLQLLNQLNNLSEIESIKQAKIVTSTLPFSQSLSTFSNDWASKSLLLSEVHRLTTGIKKIKIAVLDTGIDLDHQELQHCLLPGYDFVNILNNSEQFIGDILDADEIADDEVGHGTHVAGIIAAQGKNMPIGVAPQCSILPVRVLAAMKLDGGIVGAGLLDNINAGIKWAVDQGVDIINMSLGVEHTAGGLPHESVIRYAQQKGVTIVAASGNDGQEKLYYPAALPGVITVGAMDRDKKVASFSTYGHQVSLIAPGVDIYSSGLNNKYAFSSGTSHAAPFVSGAIALWKSYASKFGHNLTDQQIKHVLKMTSDRTTSAMKLKLSGYGALNIRDGLRLIQSKFQAPALMFGP